MSNTKEIKVLKSRSIIKFEGEDFSEQVGIDGRIFKALTFAKISVGVISQQSVENGISILVHDKDAHNAVQCLEKEFSVEKNNGVVSQIYSINNVSVISFVSENNQKILAELEKNKVFPIILNQNAAENRMNIVVTSSQDEKSRHIIESAIYNKAKTIHIAIFGHGNVGKTLINQILDSREIIQNRKNLDLKIIAIANSRKIAFEVNGFGADWEQQVQTAEIESAVERLIHFVQNHPFENLVLVDNTASKDFVKNYPFLAENGFDLVSSNKIFNTLPIEMYRQLRYILKKNNQKYLYETNVGAGLPLIDTIKLLHLSGENITRIKGVFSGSLSYIFNHFSTRQDSFSSILQEAMDKGFTEPDPREDLSGNDVARKLLILARELDLINEFSDIQIENLLPSELQKIQLPDFLQKMDNLNPIYEEKKNKQKDGHVLRYVGDLSGDLQQDKGNLKVNLVSVPAQSALGQLKGSDSIFEIYTESYGENPIVIMGAGAGAQVTARGVFGDILRLSESN